MIHIPLDLKGYRQGEEEGSRITRESHVKRTTIQIGDQDNMVGVSWKNKHPGRNFLPSSAPPWAEAKKKKSHK